MGWPYLTDLAGWDIEPVMFVLGHFFDKTKYQRCLYLPIFFVSPSFHLTFYSSQLLDQILVQKEVYGSATQP